MLINSPIINDANLMNSISSKSFSQANKGLIIDRGVMLSNYNQETIDACWEALSTNIIQNYQKGKGTYIKNLGVFTYKAEEVYLEGTTNQYIRDKKPKVPVFIVSKEHNRNFAAGEYTKQNGIRYYTQKENKDISLLKLNYAQIAYSISMSKDEVVNLIDNLISYMMDSIVQKTFESKVLPGLGTFVVRGNILAVKFNVVFVVKNKYKNNVNTFTKKNIFMDMDMDYAQDVMAKECLNPMDNIEYLKATNSLITNVEKSAKDYLKVNYNTDIKKYPQHEVKPIYRDINKNLDGSFKFINDDKKIKFNKTNFMKKKNVENIPLGFLDEETLKSLEYFKGMMIKNCKSFDVARSGTIIKEDAIKALMKTNINNKIDYNVAKNIVDYYNKTENVEYMKFIAQLIKDSHLTLLKKYSKDNSNLNNIDFNYFKRENNFNKVNNNTLYRSNGFNNDNNKKFLSQNKKFKIRKSGSCCFEEEKKPKNKEIETSLSNRPTLNSLNHSYSNLLNRTYGGEFLFNRQREVDVNKKKLSTIINLLPELKRRYFISLDQKISSEEFLNILNKYSISYPKKSIESILLFLGIPDINAFSLRDFERQVKYCKIITTSLEFSDLDEIMKTLKDIIYINCGKKFFFNNEINPKNSIDCETFVKIFKNKNVPYDGETLVNIYYFLVKNDREFNEEDYMTYFDNPKFNIKFDEPKFLSMMRKLMSCVSERNLKPDEYFDYLISYNKSTKDKVITRLNWIKYLQNENLKFSAEELDNLFLWIDEKKDGVIDREEFLKKFEFTLKPLTNIKDIIRENKLDIEDLAHRMNIDPNELEEYDYETFRNKMKCLDFTLPENFILKTFNELIKKNCGRTDKDNNQFINSKKFLDEINYVKPPENYKSFTEHYRNVVRNRISYDDLKNQFEKFDSDFLGTLTKLEYVTAMTPLFPEFNDQDHLLFLRVKNMYDKQGNITYTELLNLIYYYNKEKLSDPFTKLCEILSNVLKKECDEDIEKLMYLIESGVAKKKTSLMVHHPLTVGQIKTFLKKINSDIDIPEKIIQKLDIDADGMISFEDLRSVLKRFIHTSFFKYTNDSSDPNINLFSRETMSENKFKGIIGKLNEYIKKKNITEVGLFRKFDVDNDGFISNVDFNKVIGEILPISPAMKDQFFNYLDFYHNGLIDIDTWVAGLEGFSSTNVLIQNNNKIENEILEKLKEFIIKNNKLSDNEIFQVLDKDCDGLINIDDFKKFVVKNLGIHEKEFTLAKLQRVMMSISLSKNFQIGLNDIRELINLCNDNHAHMNLKEVFKLTTNQNLSKLKKNKEWTNDIIERLGMYVSEKYDSIEQFFNENSEPGENKFKFSNFLKFHEKHYELFNNGFNLTEDELLSIFTSLDSHKKNYLTLQDLKNKLQIYNFYTKMHIDVKNFMQENFKNGIDAFKFFIKSRNPIEKTNPEITDEEDKLKCSITLKEFFDAFENFFPGKYQTNTILKYLNKYFNIVTSNSKNNLPFKKDTINFSEFNYIYFDSIKDDNTFINKKSLNTKLMTNRDDIAKKTRNNLIHNPQNNFYYSNLFKKKYSELITPFDKDPLTKIKRIICSSKYNLNKFFESVAKECGSNNYVVNKFQFRNIIKSLDIGLSNLEIDQIMFKSGKVTYDGNLNLKEFVKYLYSINQTLEEGKNNYNPIISEIKSLVYKYYSSPIICFQNNDIKHVGKIDFEQFKNIIFDMYSRNEQKLPNFTLIKNAFDIIDLRKDGIIDINEWCKVLGSYNGKLDVGEEKVPNGFDFYDNNKFLKLNTLKHSCSLAQINNRRKLREWETSVDVSDIYKYISKNKKLIQQKIKESNYTLGTGNNRLINADNLVLILKGIIPDNKLSLTQWKMIVNVAKKDTLDGLIDLNEFFRLMEVTTKKMTSHPIVTNKKKLVKSSSDLSIYNTNGVGYKTSVNGFYFDRRRNSINKDNNLFEYSNILNKNRVFSKDKIFNKTARMEN